MISSRLEFVTLDVFTTTPFLGNPLAIIRVPISIAPPQAYKQLIAREFNLSETVFLHETATTDHNPQIVTVDIFTTERELPFAGHPTIGCSWYLLTQMYPHLQTITLRTKSGDIPAIRSPDYPGKVRLRIPTDYKSHPALALDNLKSTNVQPLLAPNDYVNGGDAPEAIASIVKGMTFILLPLRSEDALASMQRYVHVPKPPPGHLGEWDGLVCLYAFTELPDGVIRTRMFESGGLEDPATGSAASALGGWLAIRKGPGEWRMNILQGVEMGRSSNITVIATVGEDGGLDGVLLEGGAVEVMQGSIPQPR